jgi:hypothetical protein
MHGAQVLTSRTDWISALCAEDGPWSHNWLKFHLEAHLSALPIGPGMILEIVFANPGGVHVGINLRSINFAVTED